MDEPQPLKITIAGTALAESAEFWETLEAVKGAETRRRAAQKEHSAAKHERDQALDRLPATCRCELPEPMMGDAGIFELDPGIELQLDTGAETVAIRTVPGPVTVAMLRRLFALLVDLDVDVKKLRVAARKVREWRTENPQYEVRCDDGVVPF